MMLFSVVLFCCHCNILAVDFKFDLIRDYPFWNTAAGKDRGSDFGFRGYCPPVIFGFFERLSLSRGGGRSIIDPIIRDAKRGIKSTRDYLVVSR